MAQMSYDAAVVRLETYEESAVYTALKEAIDAVDGFSFLRPGMRVAIKANLMMPKKPEAAATVHPAVIRALCRLLIARGAAVVVGDSPGGPFTGAFLSTVYRACGLASLSETGAALNDDFSETEIAFSEAVVLKRIPATAYLPKADAVISLSKIKTHALMAYTGAVKNFYGAIPGMLKAEYHYRYPTKELFSNLLVDLAEAFSPVLSIGDAVWGMEGNGPSAGSPRKLNAVFASKNPHAMDLAASTIMGLTPGEVPTLQAAISRGLIPHSVKQLSVYGALEDFICPDFVKAVPQEVRDLGSRNPKIAGLIRGLLSCRPKPDFNRCVGCGECATICPAHAIHIKNRKAHIDRRCCIRCFCCQEFCPKGAISVYRPPLARLLSHRRL